MIFSEIQKRRWAGVQAGILTLMLLGGALPGGLARAAAPGDIVINEVAWAGSADSSNDEWIELYNPGAAAVDLSGWILRDDGADAFTFPAGTSIAAHAYLLMEDSETVVSNVTADLIYNMSLANTGDSLALVDAGGVVIDTVNAGGGAWYAGSSSTYATLERKAASAGDTSDNFASSTGGTGALASAGAQILGTPRALNSVSQAGVNEPTVVGAFVSPEANIGATVEMVVTAANLSDAFAYGFEVNYDPTLLEFQQVNAGGFLSANGAISTSLQSGLIAGEPGQLLVAEARTIDPKIGVNGGGELFRVQFKALAETALTSVSFGANSFISSTTGDLAVAKTNASLSIVPGTVQPVTMLQAAEGTGRYQIKLSWMASTSAPDHYRVERKDAHGDWQVLGGVTALAFVDEDGVAEGGDIIPKQAYSYRVSAVKGALVSESLEIVAQDNRGLKGDNNRSDLIDGRDLERLALHFAEDDTDAQFEPLVDTTYDGLINGNDLIDIGAGFAQRYQL